MTPGFKTIPNEPDDLGLRCVNYTLPYILLKKEWRKCHTVDETHLTVRKLEHRSHFSSFSSLWTPPLFLSLATFPLYVLPNRPHSPPSLVFIMASSLT